MTPIEIKQRDLDKLKSFIKGNVHGFVSHLWYNALRTKYPSEFIDLMEKYGNRNKSACQKEYDNKLLEEAHLRVKKLNS